ncbi:MAG: protein TonB [Paraglaciecola sp.]|jgi:protein TonB
MKNNFITKLKRFNILIFKIVWAAISLLLIFNFLLEKMPTKWQSPKERILVRDLKSIEVSPILKKEKPKPPKSKKQIFISQNNSEETTVFEKKDSSTNYNLPLEKSRKSKYSPTTIKASTPTVKQSNPSPLLLVAEEMPRFPGCETENLSIAEKQKCAEFKLLKYLQHNVDYPDIAISKGIQGVVYIQFVVKKDGSISAVTIMRDIGGNCGKEAQRVVKSMPIWTSGKQGGISTRVQFNLPVNFKL